MLSKGMVLLLLPSGRAVAGALSRSCTYAQWRRAVHGVVALPCGKADTRRLWTFGSFESRRQGVVKHHALAYNKRCSCAAHMTCS